ncbi:Facilitated trehalose transporter Tret1-2 homolog [Eumeta japonica]|uniref:Facilitated trehalose transporter Tret1-2 homolog n=1 Tax=Eumeta variegata TaxID=151549 RepID=A0A4C1YPX8_EUMVA|nr:Facilitated trehalose transporter Tret1-2 homolog [Eumeta japonica]
MGKFHQYVTAIAASFGSLAMGLLNVWPSYTQILYKNATLTPLDEPMGPVQLSLLGSLPSLGAMLGTAVVGLLMQRLGRKRAGIIISLPFVLSWSIISATRSSLIVLIARFISGAGGGAFLVYGPVFISEVAESSIRGTLASGPVAFYCLGVLISYLLGWFQTYKTIIYLNIAASVFCLTLQMLVAESPVYLLNKGKEEEARASIAHYRGASVASKPVLEELSRLKQQITPSIELVPTENPDVEQKPAEGETEKLNQEQVEYRKQSILQILIATLSNPAFRRGMLIVATALTMQVKLEQF